MFEAQSDASQVYKAQQVLAVPLPPLTQTTIVLDPSVGAFNLPPTLSASELPAVLRCRLLPPAAVRRDHLDAKCCQTFVQSVAVIRLVTDQTPRQLFHPPLLQSRHNQLAFLHTCAGDKRGNGSAVPVNYHHDGGAIAFVSVPDAIAPFLAATNVPSTKHSDRSRPCS